jgi:hypothetical protein
MSRLQFPLAVSDISAFARSLNTQLAAGEAKPTHLELMNMLARSAGFRNFQHFRASHAARDRLDAPPAAPAAVDYEQVERIARYFDAHGRLMRWPSKESHRVPCLWVMWSRLPAGETLSEAQINDMLNGHHLFGDHALLRRELFDRDMVVRTPDGREYRRLEKKPPPEALSLIRHLGLRRAA